MNGAKRKKTCGGKLGAREGDQMANMQIIFGTHYTIATKQHFNLLIFHYAHFCDSSSLHLQAYEGLMKKKSKMCVITSHEKSVENCLIKKVSLRLHNLHEIRGRKISWRVDKKSIPRGNIQFPAHKDLIGVDFADGRNQVSAFDFFSHNFFSLHWKFFILIFNAFIQWISTKLDCFHKVTDLINNFSLILA